MPVDESHVHELIRGSGWRQGCFVSRNDTVGLLACSIDRIATSSGASFRLVVVTQDCDLVRSSKLEPFIKLIGAQKIAKCDPLCGNGRDPRTLHLQALDPNGHHQCLGFSIHNRVRIHKKSLAGLLPDSTTRLEALDARLPSRWIAKRYTRPAFPDAFNLRLKAVDRQLERLFKSREGRVVSGIFLDVDDSEHRSDEPYAISVRITAKAEAWNNQIQRTDLENCERRFSSIIDRCKGVFVGNDDIRTLPEEDLTLADLRRFKRLDKDYRSLPEQRGMELFLDPSSEL